MRLTKIIGLLIALTLLLGNATFTSAALALGNDTTELSANYTLIPGRESTARIMVENKDTKPHQYNLQALGLPTGFRVNFMLDGKQTTTIKLPPADKCLMELRLEAPIKVPQYTSLFTIQLLRDDGVRFLMPMSYTVNRDYAVEITNGLEKLEVMNGKSLNFDIAVTNNGNKELQALGLLVELPSKWSAMVTPQKLNLKPGENGVFKLNIFVPPSQVSGNFALKIKSSNKDVSSQEVSLPIKVTASTGYAWWVIGFLLVVGVATILYFRKHGRR